MSDTIIVDVSANGSVSIECGTRIIAMSRFSENAMVIAKELPVGVTSVVSEVMNMEAEWLTDSARAIQNVLNG